MRYGLSFPAAGECGDPAALAEFARLAEAAGWDGIFLEDYVVYNNDVYRSLPGPPTYDPWVCLTAMAVRTRRVRLGTAVTALPRRRPWKLAREAVSVDHLSGGRLVLGLGSGDVLDKGFTHFGEEVDAKQRAGLLDEGLDVLAGLLSGRLLSYEGEHHSVETVAFLPKPVQTPRIPVWIGGAWPRKAPLRRAARWDGFVPYKHASDGDRQEDMTPDDVREIGAAVERQRPGPHPFDIVVGGEERRDDWEEERSVIRALDEAGATWWLEWVPAAGFDEMSRAVGRGPLRVD